MKQRLLFFLVLLALLLAAPALAAQTDDLTSLAQYFPFDTTMFASFRTDDATIAELDAALALVLAKLPEGIAPPDISLQSALDDLARQADLNDFSDFRAWLGDTAAAGRIMEDDPDTAGIEGALFVAQISDRAAAEAFWKAILDRPGGQPRYRVEEGDAFTLYAIESDPPTDAGLLFTDDVMLLGVANLPQILLTRDAKLAQNDSFRQTLDMLPADSYTGLVYVDLPALAEVTPNTQIAAALLGQQAIGFTLLDERSLVMDVASRLGDSAMLDNLGVSLPALQPVDTAFAANLPADTSFAIHTGNLKAVYESLVAAARASAEQEGTSPEEFERSLNQIAFGVRGLTGLDLDEDILSWMTGDFALFASVDSAALSDLMMQSMSGEPAVFETLPFSAGLIIEVTDPDKARALAAGITKALPQLTSQNDDITLAEEQIGGANVTVISAPIELQPDYNVPFDLIIGANDAVFVIATREAATAALTSIGGGASGLAGDPAFAEAARYILPNASSVWYMDDDGFSFFSGFLTLGILGPNIENVFDNIVADLETGAVSTLTPEQIQQRQEEQTRQRQEQMRQTQGILTFLNSVLNSGTVSTTSVDGGALTRLVATLAE